MTALKHTVRENTSDARVFEEVLIRRCYRKASVQFDVEPGERWLDLGANVGAFAVYAKQRGATAVCYEPDPECFQILRSNAAPFPCVCAAITAHNAERLPFFHSQKVEDHSRGTILAINKFRDAGSVKNVFAGSPSFLTMRVDGIKMDIEGAEGPLIDNWYFPPCEKLVMEYHTSRDSSVANFASRLVKLKSKFHHVSYPEELDRIAASGAKRFEKWVVDSKLPKGGRFVQWPAADRLIFCWSPK